MNKAENGFTLWFTGLPSSGKSTLANLVAQALKQRGIAVEVLDGDTVRQGLSRGLGYTKEDRDENIRRIGFVCRLLSRHGVAAISAAISPYRAIRDEVRASIPNFVEAYVKASRDTCMARDVKGLYKKALAGEIKNFTGVDDPYEPPFAPELVLDTERESPEALTARILDKLEQLSLVARQQEPAYAPEEAEKIRARLTHLGYIE